MNKYDDLKKKIGSKEKHMKPVIAEGEYGKLKGWEKGILQSGDDKTVAKTGASRQVIIKERGKLIKN